MRISYFWPFKDNYCLISQENKVLKFIRYNGNVPNRSPDHETNDALSVKVRDGFGVGCLGGHVGDGVIVATLQAGSDLGVVSLALLEQTKKQGIRTSKSKSKTWHQPCMGCWPCRTR